LFGVVSKFAASTTAPSTSIKVGISYLEGIDDLSKVSVRKHAGQ